MPVAVISDAYVVVSGLSQIQRDLERSMPEAARVLRDGLKIATQPTADVIELFALARVRNMPRSPQWALTRIGVTRQGTYIVPKQRGVKSRNPYDPRRRPNLVALMLERAYEPGAEIGARRAEAAVLSLLDSLHLVASA